MSFLTGSMWRHQQNNNNNKITNKKNKNSNKLKIQRKANINFMSTSLKNTKNTKNTNNTNNNTNTSNTKKKIITKKNVNIQRRQGTKGYWGYPTWVLFHSLAEKVNADKYKLHYDEFWNFIKLICLSLPCPYCKNHATKYINSIPLTSINTKEKVINVLYTFHNNVNLRTGKKQENKDILAKYKNANLNRILEFFMNRFFMSYIGRRQFDDWIKNNIKSETITFWDFYKKNLL